jgi:hypothetical protein
MKEREIRAKTKKKFVGDRHGIGKHGEEMKSAREREARFRV